MTTGDSLTVIDEYVDDTNYIGLWHSPSVVKITDTLFCMVHRIFNAEYRAEIVSFLVDSDGTITAPIDKLEVADALIGAEGLYTTKSLDIAYMGGNVVAVASLDNNGTEATLSIASVTSAGVLSLLDAQNFSVGNNFRAGITVNKLSTNYVVMGFTSPNLASILYTKSIDGGSITSIDDYDFGDYPTVPYGSTAYPIRIAGTNIVALTSGGGTVTVSITDAGVITDVKIDTELVGWVKSKPFESSSNVILGGTCGTNNGSVSTRSISSTGVITLAVIDSLKIIDSFTPVQAGIAPLGGTLYAVVFGKTNDTTVAIFNVSSTGIIDDAVVDSIDTGGVFSSSYQSDIVRARDGMLVVVGKSSFTPDYFTITTIEYSPIEQFAVPIEDRVTRIRHLVDRKNYLMQLSLGGLETRFNVPGGQGGATGTRELIYTTVDGVFGLYWVNPDGTTELFVPPEIQPAATQTVPPFKWTPPDIDRDNLDQATFK